MRSFGYDDMVAPLVTMLCQDDDGMHTNKSSLRAARVLAGLDAGDPGIRENLIAFRFFLALDRDWDGKVTDLEL